VRQGAAQLHARAWRLGGRSTMSRKIVAVATLMLATALGLTTVQGEASPALAGTGVGVKVASFNIQSVSLDRNAGAQKPWRKRRGAVIRQVLEERPDVLGVQEANPSRWFRPRLVDGVNQYLDLRNGLNKAGGPYQLTNRYAYNCVNPRTSHKCRYQDRGASHSNRIYYNAGTVERVSQGCMRYAAQHVKPGNQPRDLAWAVLRMKATGAQFLFTTTHLEVTDRSTRQQQWQEMIEKINSLKGSLPVIATGDFNMQKFDPMATTMLPAMQSAGYGDVLGQQYAENPVRHMRALSRVNAWINSANHESRNVADYGYEDRRDKVGNSIDWIFATNSLRVDQYKVVLRFDPRTLLVQGVLPSDHNMVEAILTLP
jgi:endonuclease/exonuclease/phosphatase family metal-dependent hydrolase